MQRLVDAFLPDGPTADAVRGDLHQEFEARRRKGAFSAHGWYLRQALSVILWAAFDRLRGRAWDVRRGSSDKRLSGAAHTRRTLLDTLEDTAGIVVLAGRRLRRAPAFTTAVVSILALGIGANALMFGIVDRLLLSPPEHIVDAEYVRLLHVTDRPRPAAFLLDVVATQRISYPDYLDFRDVRAFADVAAYTFNTEETVGRGATAHRAKVTSVTPNLFPLLGVQASLGRFFPWDETDLAASRGAVLADEYWVRAWVGIPRSSAGPSRWVGGPTR